MTNVIIKTANKQSTLSRKKIAEVVKAVYAKNAGKEHGDMPDVNIIITKRSSAKIAAKK